MRRKPRLIGEILVDKGVVSRDQVAIALTEQKKTGQHLGKLLVRLGFASEAIIREVLGGELGQQSIDLAKVVVDPEAVKLIPKDVARRYHVLCISFDPAANRATVAMADTFNVVALDKIRTLLGVDVEILPFLAGEAEIDKTIDQVFGYELSVDGILKEIETGEVDYQSLEGETDEYSQPVVRLVNALLSDAVKRGASDIHIEPFANALAVRYRIDGLFYAQPPPPRPLENALIARLKVMAKLDLAEKRLPQDGVARVRVGAREIDVRVSSVPVAEGERIVLRLLHRESTRFTLNELGMSAGMLEEFRGILRAPHGIVLVTGPTGSGKTTTLYAALRELDTAHLNVLTIEDPIEYQLPDIGQMQVHPKIGLTFARGLRHVLRQDPDVVLVGETRDLETAEIVVRASLTGHLVFTTLHTNDATGAVTRLVDMGIAPYLLASAARAVLAQRLVRRLCPKCRRETALTAEEAAWLGQPKLAGRTGA